MLGNNSGKRLQEQAQRIVLSLVFSQPRVLNNMEPQRIIKLEYEAVSTLVRMLESWITLNSPFLSNTTPLPNSLFTSSAPATPVCTHFFHYPKPVFPFPSTYIPPFGFVFPSYSLLIWHHFVAFSPLVFVTYSFISFLVDWLYKYYQCQSDLQEIIRPI